MLTLIVYLLQVSNLASEAKKAHELGHFGYLGR